MRRFLFVFLLLFFTLPVFAQDSTVQITFPEAVSTVQGIVTITGTVNPSDLQTYFFEVADANADPNTTAWTPVTLPSSAPVTGGALAQFNTTIVANGVYTLRLRVIHTSGEITVVTVTPLRIENDPNAPPPQTNVEPTQAAAETPEIVPRPTVVNDLPVPVGGQLDNFDEDAIPLMQQAGMTWIKWQIPFVIGDSSLITVARDRINWSHEHGFFVFLSIKGNKDELGQQGSAYYPLYAEFVGQLAALQPDAIQVWNEMNLDREWPQGQIDPRSYTELLRQAHDAIKAVAPTIKVVTGAPSPTGAEGAFGLDRVWNDDRYYLGMANAGAAQYADCIGIHYNEGIISPRQQGGDPRGDYPTYYFPLMLQRALFPFRSTGERLCFSEMGYLSADGYGTLPSGFAWGANTSVQEQAEWLADAVQVAAENGNVDLIIVFNVNFTQFVDNDPQGGYAIIRPDGSCPACQALASLRTSG
ncbi:MAG: hypothetical protein IT319_09580 [Anaerolineae bacterium]|nr:hypothetical protein [Anaerolineae bacterium]